MRARSTSLVVELCETIPKTRSETITRFSQDFIVTSRTKIEIFIKLACVLAIFIILILMIVPAIKCSCAVIIPIVHLSSNGKKVWFITIRPHFSKHFDQSKSRTFYYYGTIYSKPYGYEMFYQAQGKKVYRTWPLSISSPVRILDIYLSEYNGTVYMKKTIKCTTVLI
jgi:hypothetical protein